MGGGFETVTSGGGNFVLRRRRNMAWCFGMSGRMLFKVGQSVSLGILILG